MNDAAYRALLELLFASKRRGIVMGLGRVREVLNRLGSPDHAFRSIQVAGTNGKGTTSVMIAELLRAAGHEVAIFTSPHLERFTERFVINGEEVSQQDVVDAVDAIRWAGGADLTFFEWSTCIALWLFARAQVDFAVLEVGLGGRLDATSAARVEVAVVTGVALDHCEMLGTTIDAIAKEKAAIARRGRPAVVGLSGVARGQALIAEDMKSRGAAPVHVISEQDLRDAPTHRLGVDRINAACAWHAFRYIEPGFNPARACDVLDRASLRGRKQVISDRPYVVVDGAHNPDACAALAADLGSFDVVVLGVCANKDVAGIAQALAPLSKSWIATQATSERALEAAALGAALEEWHGSENVRVAKNFDQVAMMLEPSQRVLICGSLFLVSDALSHFDS